MHTYYFCGPCMQDLWTAVVEVNQRKYRGVPCHSKQDAMDSAAAAALSVMPAIPPFFQVCGAFCGHHHSSPQVHSLPWRSTCSVTSLLRVGEHYLLIFLHGLSLRCSPLTCPCHILLNRRDP